MAYTGEGGLCDTAEQRAQRGKGGLAGFLIGIEPDGLPYVKHWLERAAERGPVPVLDTDELLWTVRAYRDGVFHYVGAATARLVADAVEVVLVGGVGLGWIGPLSDKLTAWARDEGKAQLWAYGRKGWRRALPGWEAVYERDGLTAYRREVVNG